MTEKILITGGAGFIGSNLIEFLIKKSYDPVILDIKENIKNIEEITDYVTYIQGDIRNESLLRKKIFECYKIVGVIHLAAVSRVVLGEHNPDLCRSVNIDGTRNILKSIINSNQKPWLIFGSSREVYGNPEVLPVKESFPIKPISVYGETKVAGEKLVSEYAMKKNISAIILRFSNTYGNEKDILDRVVPKLIIRALNNENLTLYGSKKIFDFTHISDTIYAIFSSIDYLSSFKKGFLRTFNISYGEGVTLLQLAKFILEITGAKVDIIDKPSKNYEVQKYVGDISLAREVLKFNPKVSIKEGIPLTIKRLREVLTF